MRVLFSSDAGQFQLLFLLLPCAVSVPSPFPVPFQCLFQCLFTVCVRLPVFLFQQNLPETHFCWQGHEKVQKALEKALERHWEQTRHMATVRTVAGTALHLACFPDVCCPRSQRVDVKELSTED